LGCSLGTFWLGNRYALGRDKRKEWNPIASAHREVLERQIEGAAAGNVMSGLRDGMDEVEFYLSPFRRSGFRRELERYRKAEHDLADSCRKSRFGLADQELLAELIRRATSLLGYLNRR
jgi:hypothetical protein